ncbi:hypothetical protein G9C85_16695 [Halorubellus sp. JP-L1]|uniref:hypothetical protein n=1 Tax=Halorubellus sp. JP-L1 TaxID=2715753 RepID=UPI00140AD32F|nr:hypothetical protein [Halorubellus sp. JP-L1]NHN43257.1 hypothetical protein [Halorubellus sp. JP-L1]
MTLSSLPDRPLTGGEVQALNDQENELSVAPANYVPEQDRVYAVYFVRSDRGHAVVFDADAAAWTVLEAVDDSVDGAFGVLQDAVSEWAETAEFDDEFVEGETTVDFDDPDAVVEDLDAR